MNTIKYSLAGAIALFAVNISAAGDCCCPGCGEKYCKPVEAPKTEKKHCYEIECKDICIPHFRWPWQQCCAPKCSRVKTVRTFKKVEYECKYCGYKWDIIGGCGKGACNGKGSCDAAAGGKSNADAPPVPVDAASLNFRIHPVINAPTPMNSRPQGKFDGPLKKR